MIYETSYLEYDCRIHTAAWFVADIPPVAGTAFLRDLHNAQEAVRAGNTQDV